MMPKKECVKNWLVGQFGDDEAIIAEIYGEYLKTTRENLDKADAAMARGDFPGLDRVAHTLKGNALMVGDQDIADTAIALRNAAKISDAANGSTLLVRLRELIAQA